MSLHDQANAAQIALLSALLTDRVEAPESSSAHPLDELTPAKPLDILIVGGGFAGLSAALYTARGLKRGAMVTTGPSRNAPSPQAGGVFSRDRQNPAQLLAAARDDLRPYDFPVIEAEVTGLTGLNGAFTATLQGGRTLQARKVILATGVHDVLPDQPAGLREQWGTGVHHCPYCYGWELRGGQIALFMPGLTGLSGVQSVLYHQKITRDVLVCTEGPAALTVAERALLAEQGVTLVEEPLIRVDGRDGGGVRLNFASGLTLDQDVLYAHGRRQLRATLAEQLGCAVTPAGITVDEGQMTTVAGVYACGDVTRGNQIAFAVSSGAMAAMQAAYALFYDTLPEGARRPVLSLPALVTEMSEPSRSHLLDQLSRYAKRASFLSVNETALLLGLTPAAVAPYALDGRIDLGDLLAALRPSTQPPNACADCSLSDL